MVHKCCVSVCGMSVRIPGAKGLSYHVFPVKEPNRDKWIQAILPHVDKPESFRIVQGYTRVCSRHFKKKDYSIDSRKRARLSSSKNFLLYYVLQLHINLKFVIANLCALRHQLDIAPHGTMYN